MLKLLMEGNQEIVDYILSNIAVGDFDDARVRQVAEIVLERRQHGNYAGVETLVHLVDDPVLKDLITTISLSKYELSHGWQTAEKEIVEGDPWQIARDAIIFTKRRALQKDLEENQRRLKEANEQGAESMPFLQRHQEILRQIRGLDSAAAQKS